MDSINCPIKNLLIEHLSAQSTGVVQRIEQQNRNQEASGLHPIGGFIYFLFLKI